MLNIIFELAKVYQLNVVVEGVETETDFQYIKELGCEVAQGYYFTKPITWDYVMSIHKPSAARHLAYTKKDKKNN